MNEEFSSNIIKQTFNFLYKINSVTLVINLLNNKFGTLEDSIYSKYIVFQSIIILVLYLFFDLTFGFYGVWAWTQYVLLYFIFSNTIYFLNKFFINYDFKNIKNNNNEFFRVLSYFLWAILFNILVFSFIFEFYDIYSEFSSFAPNHIFNQYTNIFKNIVISSFNTFFILSLHEIYKMDLLIILIERIINSILFIVVIIHIFNFTKKNNYSEIS